MTFVDFLLSVLASLIATVIAGLLVWKFDWFSIRKDKAIRLDACHEAARACVARWQGRLYDADYTKSCGLHADSLGEIESKVYDVFGFGKVDALEKAWDDYRILDPSKLPDGKDLKYRMQVVPRDPNSIRSLGWRDPGPSAQEEIMRALEALHKALS